MHCIDSVGCGCKIRSDDVDKSFWMRHKAGEAMNIFYLGFVESKYPGDKLLTSSELKVTCGGEAPHLAGSNGPQTAGSSRLK